MADASASTFEPDLVTCDMIAQMSYCPRRFHLMYVEGRFEHNHHTLEGKAVHRRVDRIDQPLPPTEGAEANAEDPGDAPPVIVRSVPLQSESIGLSGKLDLASCDPEGGEAIPVETKKGIVPDNPEQSWEPERVQLTSQGLLLREAGYRCGHGYLYYAGSRKRVRIDFTPELEARTLELIAQARAAAHAQKLPDPLEDSPKCWGCSLHGICLPDETLALRESPPDPAAPEVRRLYPSRDDAVPFYVQEQGARVGKRGSTLQVERKREKIGSARLKDVSQVCLMGNVQISTQTVHTLCEAGIPIVHLSSGGWFYGVTQGWGLRNAFDRAAQFQAAQDPAHCLKLAIEIVSAKIANQRTLLMRNARPRSPEVEASITEMARLIKRTAKTTSIESLLGYEGQAAAAYFRSFDVMLTRRGDEAMPFSFSCRNRRPPRDPVNAMLSFAYALLSKECTVALMGEGLDPWWGFYHRPRHGRPALALDLMEPFRPLIADSAVISAVNNNMLKPSDFTTGAGACVMKPNARKALIQAWEARIDQLMTHPVFDYRCSWRSAIRIQARLLARYLRGDVNAWPFIRTR